VPLAKPALQVNLAKLANPVKTALQVPPVVQEMLVPQAVQAKLAAQALQESPARTAHPALANTAHRLVWLQVIKRSTSRAIRLLQRRQLGRMLDNERKDQFVQDFSHLVYTAFSIPFINSPVICNVFFALVYVVQQPGYF
jgi:hypothetical protein